MTESRRRSSSERQYPLLGFYVPGLKGSDRRPGVDDGLEEARPVHLGTPLTRVLHLRPRSDGPEFRVGTTRGRHTQRSEGLGVRGVDTIPPWGAKPLDGVRLRAFLELVDISRLGPSTAVMTIRTLWHSTLI